mgnify:FL=1
MNDLELNEDGVLYVVATPIGNLEDITFRAIKVLEGVDCIAAEDTRHTLKLLNHFNISKPLISYYRHNEDDKSDFLIQKLLNGESIALVSDAGTPGICDPGQAIIYKCIQNGIKIVPIPGACAMINALICSGLDTNKFKFMGFLSINKKIRKQELEEIKKSDVTIILYEAPHKLKDTLKDLASALENRMITIARELTKIHEEFVRGTANELLQVFDNPKGEFVLIIEKTDKTQDEEKLILQELTLEQHYQYYLKKGFSKNEIIKRIAKDRNVNKNEIYKKFV